MNKGDVKMKRYISAILIPCLLWQLMGCYAFRTLESDEDINVYLQSNDKLNFRLNNGEKITTNGNERELRTRQKFILFGTGILTNLKSIKSKIFKGEIEQSTIDSVRSVSLDSIEYIVAWLKDTTRISFEKQNVIFNSTLNPDSNYLLITNYENPRIINVNDLSGIEVEEKNVGITIALVLFIAVCVIGAVIMSIQDPISIFD